LWLHSGKWPSHDGRRRQRSRRERRRERVLPWRVERRAQKLPRHKILSATQTLARLATEGDMNDYYEEREAAPPHEREERLFAQLPQALKRARERAPAIALQMQGVDPEAVRRR